MYEKLYDLRRTLHQYPEIAGEESSTAVRILDYFQSLHPDLTFGNLGGQGLAFVFQGKESGPRSLFRAELDALPIHEQGKLDYISKTPGKAHLCGHDGHMAILCGLGEKLAAERPKKGEVVLLFQPAEETGEGASRILEDPDFEAIYPDQAFALHNLPGFPLHSVIVKAGPITAGSTGMTITLTGKTSHAAHPEDGINPAQALAKLIQLLTHLPQKIPGFSLVTFIHAELGSKAFGTSAGKASLSVTIRAFDQDELEMLVDLAKEMVIQEATSEGLEVEFSFQESFAVSENDPELTDFGKRTAQILDLNLIRRETPFLWSEDFGLFTQVCPSFFFGLGSGEDTPQLHEPTYDFPDELIPTGIRIFHSIARQIHH